MEHTWRWFGPHDPITLAQVRQTGATGVVTALHEVPNGEVWTVGAIAARQAEIARAGLTWSVVESVPVHEHVKRALPTRDRYLENYATTLRNLARCGITTVCYNFMPVLDWTRTDLRHPTPDGGWALRFDHTRFTVFDVHLLAREGAAAGYDDADLEAAARLHAGMTDHERDELVRTVIAGLPGAEENHTLDTLREALAGYAGVDAAGLREAFGYFLDAVVPTAAEVGVRLGVHPDDPPRPLLGLPRVVSTADDLRWVLARRPEPVNGLTFCTGSLGPNPDNDLVAMAREFAPRIHFAHLRNTRREADPRSFHEAYHVGGGPDRAGDADLVGVVRELVLDERRRLAAGGTPVPLRPDHGHQLLDDQHRVSNPGYSLIGRLKGLAELRGLEAAVQALVPA